MNSESHEGFQRRIDQRLAGEIADREELLLREHLETCTICQQYLSAGSQVIASLGGFSFAVDPALREKVSASLALRSQQLKAQPDRRRLLMASSLALLFTIAGSFLDLRLGAWVAAILDLRPGQIQQPLISFWIVPSLCLLLLFPLLPLLSKGELHRKDRSQ